MTHDSMPLRVVVDLACPLDDQYAGQKPWCQEGAEIVQGR